MTNSLKKIAIAGLVAIATLATASSAFADRNQYTGRRVGSPRHHMGHMMRPMHRHPMMRHPMMRHHMMRRHAM